MEDYHMLMMNEPRYPKRFYGYQAVQRNLGTYNRYGRTWNMASARQRKARVNDNYVGAGKYKRVKSPMYRRLKGRGIYTGNFAGQGNYFNRMMRRQMNKTFSGSTPLGALGKKIGRRALGAVEGIVTGQGEYDLNGDAPVSNNLVAGGGLSVPTFSTQSDETGSLTIQHSEYVKDIYGVPWTSNPPGTPNTIVQPFKNDPMALNPGLASTFPWLSQIAANYEEYEIQQLMFCFKTRIGDNLTTTDGQVGTLLMFTDYNATDHPRQTKQDMLQGYGTSVSKISDSDIIHGIECDPTKIKGDAHKFVRTGGTSQDLHDFDWGLFQIAVDNTPEVLSNKVIGELYVSYTVRLSKPRLYSQLGNAIQQDQAIVVQTRGSSGSSSVALAATGVSNSIGAQFVATSVNHPSQDLVEVTLPGSFSGPFEVAVIGDKVTGFLQGAAYEASYGNVSLKRDLTSSHVGSDDVDPGAGTTGMNGTAGDHSVSLFHFNTTMAAFGEDNKVSFKLWCDGGSNPQEHKWLVMIRRYNALDKQGADAFITPQGNKYIIPSN